MCAYCRAEACLHRRLLLALSLSIKTLSLSLADADGLARRVRLGCSHERRVASAAYISPTVAHYVSIRVNASDLPVVIITQRSISVTTLSTVTFAVRATRKLHRSIYLGDLR